MTRQIALLLVMSASFANGRDFLGARTDLDDAYIASMMQGALDGMLGIGHGVDAARLAAINATLSPIFNVLPKNQLGRLSHPFFKYTIRRYFSQTHGWVIK